MFCQWTDPNKKRCLELLLTNQFIKLSHHASKSIEGKIKCLLRNFKFRLQHKQYNQLYLTGSCARKFYGTATIHKFPLDGNISDLPLTLLMIKSIGTTSCQLVKYLAQLLSPLIRPGYSVSSTKDPIVKIKNRKILQNYSMVSIDVKYFFTSIPLEQTTDIIIKQIFEDYNHEITTILTKSEMKKLLNLYTKNVRFSFNKKRKVLYANLQSYHRLTFRVSDSK